MSGMKVLVNPGADYKLGKGNLIHPVSLFCSRRFCDS
jgi:hypothetical protein